MPVCMVTMWRMRACVYFDYFLWNQLSASFPFSVQTVASVSSSCTLAKKCIYSCWGGKKRLSCCLTITHVSIFSYNQPIVSLYRRYSQRGSGVTGVRTHSSQIGHPCSLRKLLCAFNSKRAERDLNAEMSRRLRASTPNPVLLALSHARSRRDGASSHWIGPNRCGKRRLLFLAPLWSCAFPNLAY